MEAQHLMPSGPCQRSIAAVVTLTPGAAACQLPASAACARPNSSSSLSASTIPLSHSPSSPTRRLGSSQEKQQSSSAMNKVKNVVAKLSGSSANGSAASDSPRAHQQARAAALGVAAASGAPAAAPGVVAATPPPACLAMLTHPLPAALLLSRLRPVRPAPHPPRRWLAVPSCSRQGRGGWGGSAQQAAAEVGAFWHAASRLRQRAGSEARPAPLPPPVDHHQHGGRCSGGAADHRCSPDCCSRCVRRPIRRGGGVRPGERGARWTLCGRQAGGYLWAA